MGKLTVFQFMTLDGYYADPDADTSWHTHVPGGESSGYAAEMLALGSTLLFGRLTYEFMASFWPTPTAKALMPEVAAAMNAADKVVFSRTLETADWKNTSIVRGDAVQAVKGMKESSAKELTVLGSASLLRQFSESGLVDEFQFMLESARPRRGAFDLQRREAPAEPQACLDENAQRRPGAPLLPTLMKTGVLGDAKPGAQIAPNTTGPPRLAGRGVDNPGLLSQVSRPNVNRT